MEERIYERFNKALNTNKVFTDKLPPNLAIGFLNPSGFLDKLQIVSPFFYLGFDYNKKEMTDGTYIYSESYSLSDNHFLADEEDEPQVVNLGNLVLNVGSRASSYDKNIILHLTYHELEHCNEDLVKKIQIGFANALYDSLYKSILGFSNMMLSDDSKDMVRHNSFLIGDPELKKDVCEKFNPEYDHFHDIYKPLNRKDFLLN